MQCIISLYMCMCVTMSYIVVVLPSVVILFSTATLGSRKGTYILG